MELNGDIPHIPGFAKFSIAFTQTPEATGKRTVRLAPSRNESREVLGPCPIRGNSSESSIDVGIGLDPGLEAPQRGRDLFSRLRYRDAA